MKRDRKECEESEENTRKKKFCDGSRDIMKEFFDACVNGKTEIVRRLLRVGHGALVNAVNINTTYTVLHIVAQRGDVDTLNVLIQNGANVNAWCVDFVDLEPDTMYETEMSVLALAAYHGRLACTLQLLCFGAEIDETALHLDNTGTRLRLPTFWGYKVLQPIYKSLESLRARNGMKTALMSVEERHFMWNLAFFFTIKYCAAAFKAYYAVRSFITFHGIFMGPGYALGDKSLWVSVSR